jgi:hypothetical protein
VKAFFLGGNDEQRVEAHKLHGRRLLPAGENSCRELEDVGGVQRVSRS